MTHKFKLLAVGAFALTVLAACGEDTPESTAQTGGEQAGQEQAAQETGAAPIETSSPAGDVEISAVPLRIADANDPFVQDGYAVGDIVEGDPNAPVTIIEYSSLTCPHCAAYHRDAYPTIKKDYVDTGKVRVVVREVYFDQFGLLASAVARCGGAQRYNAFLNVIFEQQATWIGSGERDAVINGIRQIGQFGGLGADRVEACLANRAFQNQLLQNYQDAAGKDGVQSTPTFLINGEVVRGNVGLDELRAVIDRKLEG